MKTENYLGMIAHIAPPPPKTTPPPSFDEGGVRFHCRDVPWRVSTDGGSWNYSMLRYSSTIPPAIQHHDLDGVELALTSLDVLKQLAGVVQTE